jgi:NADH-quinone oxidoreductase subunit N
MRKSWVYTWFIFFFVGLSILILGTTFMLILNLYAKLPTQTFYYLENVFVSNSLLNGFKCFIIIVTIIILIMSLSALKNDNLPVFEFVILILLSVLGMLLMVSANNLFFIYLTIEFIGLNFYALTGLRQNSNFAAEAALKYFTISGYSSCVLLLGVSFIYGGLGTLNLLYIAELLINANVF